ncbi:unnamed protein product [Musa acuminata subsp. malaccensis]|uniref:(wild Malaysian banana) hypothetical protein n=1 Tax=Musa acuminata subsp. malaccensis TaxID=214687 RepID=A0A804HPN7_MUSAM|nr:PREDICTED: uncharacterized protein LOC103979409 isoform X1 [Musa acuminata subsp. malaccensis]CAG1858384.1 unnamed protein product [Musa acuminata subsp. malaccensis]
MASFFLFLCISSLILCPPSQADDANAVHTPLGTIQRETKQQILATVPPNPSGNTEPFLTSPLGKYVGYLLRRETAPGAGGMGNDFCYIQIQEAASGASVWESECEPVSSANACSLVFCDAGLALFDGSNPVWDTGASGHNNFPATLELVDHGDMRVIDKDGELVWKASDDARVNQHCGLPGSPGLPSGAPPFVGPIGGDDNPPFGQQPQQTTPYPTNGALPLAPASAPLVAPASGDENSNGDLPLAPASAPLVAPASGDENSNGDLPLAPASAPLVAPASGDENSNGDLPLAPAHPPVVAPTGGADDLAAGVLPSTNPINGAFGQQQQPHGLHGVTEQPLVDNTPYDSGSSGKEGSVVLFFSAVVGHLMLYGF